MTLDELLEQLHIGETQDVEFKKAENELPNAIWESLSAFANTEGGTIVLGVSEKKQICTVTGVTQPKAIIKRFWDIHNNPQKLNLPLCLEKDLQIHSIDHKTVICITVPKATRRQRPIYINNHPLNGSYKRNYEGDYRCTEAEVRQMLRDADSQAADSRILEGFTLEDLDRDTLAAYRNRFSARDQDHPFLALDTQAFLESLGGWRRDRVTKQEGITLAGLLMFGKERSLLDALPRYYLDYQEKFSSNAEVRWDYRINLDGRWQPNLFNFYYRVYQRLIQNIQTPFKLDHQATRQDENHVHQALREALVNTLAHSDHETDQTIKIMQYKDAYVFRNAGRLRVLREQLYRGGNSDPRNPNLLTMFQLLGLGERSGSGFPKIYRAWQEQHWVLPLIREDLTLNTTELHLSLASFIPQELEQHIINKVGEMVYRTLEELARSILIIVHSLGEVCNEDIQPYRQEHPHDISQTLKRLVDMSCLEKSGYGRGTKYRISSLDNKATAKASSEHLSSSSEHSKTNSEHSKTNSEHSKTNSEHSKTNSEHLTLQTQELNRITLVVANTKYTARANMEQIILELCKIDWRTLNELAQLLNRKPDSLRNHYINPLLKAGKLQALTPDKRNNPKQAYKSTNHE